MPTQRFQRFLPLAGIVFSLLFAAVTVLTKNEPSESATTAKAFAYWHGHQTVENVSAFLLIPLAAFFLLLFGAGLRAALRSGEAGEASYSAVAYAGAIFAAAGFAVIAMLDGATANSAHEGAQSAVYTLNQLNSFSWVTWTAGFAAMLIAAGLGGLRTHALPRVLSWVAIPIGIAFVTPAGEIAFFALPFWVLATSIALHLRGRDVPAMQARLVEQAA